jgi:hypothetical protein
MSLKSIGSELILSLSILWYHISEVVLEFSSHRAWGYVGNRCGWKFCGLTAGISRDPPPRCAAEYLLGPVQGVVVVVDKVCERIRYARGGGGGRVTRHLGVRYRRYARYSS